MSTFSLLQKSLDQTISREDLEEASTLVPSVARADCVKMQRELYGVLVSGLSRDGAEGFQVELKRRGFETDLVWDGDVPVLHESYQIRRLARSGEVIVMINSMGQELSRPIEELVFVSAGYLDGGRLGRDPRFRVDLFFSSSPHRVHLHLSDDTVIFYEGRMIRLKDSVEILALSESLATWVPRDRMNQHLRRREVSFVYPTMECYEEELRWHFYQLTPR